LAGWPPERTRK